MAKVNFQINDLEIDDAIPLIVGMQIGINNTAPIENDFTNMLKKSLSDLKNQVIECIGNNEYLTLYNQIFNAMHGIVPNTDGKLKTNC